MKDRVFLTYAGAIATALLVPVIHLPAATIDRATITEVVRDVKVIEPVSKRQSPAQVQSVFVTPNILRTGPNSRAEMVAPDQTVTRIGANTLFSFEPEKREINLQRGSILFQTPTGKGGGTIKTAAATASVLGTTLIVSTTKNGGFKVLLLEGKGKVNSPNGDSRALRPGQVVFALPGDRLSPVINFELKEQASSSKLVNGFKRELPSMPKIQAAIAQQEAGIAKGSFLKTGLLAGDNPFIAYQVDPNARMVRSNTESGGGDGGAFNALTTDAVIDSPTLEEARVFRISEVPAAVGNFGVEQSMPLSGDLGFFLARNTTVDTSEINLSSFSGVSVFGFISAQDLIINQTVSITGADSFPLFFFAGGTIRPAAGVSLSANTPSLNLVALGPMIWDGFTLANSAGDVNVFGGNMLWDSSRVASAANINVSGANLRWVDSRVLADVVNVSGSQVVWNRTSVSGRSEVNVDSSGDVRIADAEQARRPIGGVIVPVGPDRTLRAPSYSINAGGEVELNRVNFIARDLTIVAQDALRMNNVLFGPLNAPSATAPPQGNVKLSADDFIAANGVNFQVQNVAMQARTIALRNVNFRSQSRVILDSASGQLAPNPNTGRPVRVNDVNFISGVTYGGQPAQQAVGNQIIVR